jgi:hypothetical protein
MSLEKFLKGEALSPYIVAIRDGLEDDSPEAGEIVRQVVREFGGNYAPSDDDREHLRRLLTEPGWHVLLKLLDNDIQSSEDAAKRESQRNPLGEGMKTAWVEAAYYKKARDKMLAMLEFELAKLAASKAAEAVKQKAEV